MAAAIVVTPMQSTIATRMPASKTGAARGSSTCQRTCRGVIPIPRAASMTEASTSSMPVAVFRKIGSNAYRASATIAVLAPTPRGSQLMRSKRARSVAGKKPSFDQAAVYSAVTQYLEGGRPSLLRRAQEQAPA